MKLVNPIDAAVALAARSRGVLLRALPVAGLVALLAATPALAQGGRRGPDLDTQMTTLTERLDLDEEQATAVRAILEELNASRRELFSQARDGSGDFAALREKMAELQAKTDEQMAEVLTEAQMAEYRKQREEQRARRGGRRPPG